MLKQWHSGKIAQLRLVKEYLLLENVEICDNSDDHGVDFYWIYNNTFSIYQVKMNELDKDNNIQLNNFNSDGIRDLNRAYNILMGNEENKTRNQEFNKLKHLWDDARSKSKNIEDEKLQLKLNLVIIGNDLTDSARREYNAFNETLKNNSRENEIEFELNIMSINDIIFDHWQIKNNVWKDKDGNKKEDVSLYYKESRNAYLEANGIILAFVKAYDLVDAYQQLGQQIFEPNVRCQIPRSKINSAIMESAMHEKGQKDFMLLNNGVTIMVNSYTKKETKNYINLKKPGIVNGLQTVTSLYDAYKEMSYEKKNSFKNNCFVLARIIRNDKVPNKDVNRLVKATNLQNEMEPRNFVSNNHEQLIYEQLFAKYNWFYSRKDGAWDAFKLNYKTWKNLDNMRPEDFKYNGKEKRIENTLVAQTQLAFSGFSNEATNKTKDLFDEEKLFYKLVFLSRILGHGSKKEYDYTINKVKFSEYESPSFENLILSSLLHKIMRELVPSVQSEQKKAIKRMNIDPNEFTYNELRVRLNEDDNYYLMTILNNMTFSLIECFGYILYKIYGNDWNTYKVAKRILNTGTINEYLNKKEIDFTMNDILKDNIDKDDFFQIVFQFIIDTVKVSMSQPQVKDSFLKSTKAKYLHGKDFRKQIGKWMDENSDFMKKMQKPKSWAIIEINNENYYEKVKRKIESNN